MKTPYVQYSKKTSIFQMGKVTPSGFSLVELSVVLVIIGLLTGVLVTAQQMIESAKGKAVLGEMNDMLQALDAFQARYHYRPGDVLAAEKYFTGDALPTGTGDFSQLGNSRIDTTAEREIMWPQLFQGGMIKSNITRVANPDTTTRVIGVNRPASTVTGGGWTWLDSYTLSGNDYYNVLRFGAVQGANGGEYLEKPVLSLANHRYIDSKVDEDNTPLTGKITVGEAACLSGAGYTTNDDKKCTLNVVEDEE